MQQQKKKSWKKTSSLLKLTDLSYPICLEVDTNTVTVWRSQREEPNLTGRGFTNLGVVCVCVDFYSFFWSEEASFRRCSVFKAQTRRGSVFQAAEVVMKAGAVRVASLCRGERGGFDCRRSCSSQTSKCRKHLQDFPDYWGKAPRPWCTTVLTSRMSSAWRFESANVLPLLV